MSVRSRREIVHWLLENGVPDRNVDRAAVEVEQEELADYFLFGPPAYVPVSDRRRQPSALEEEGPGDLSPGELDAAADRDEMWQAEWMDSRGVGW